MSDPQLEPEAHMLNGLREIADSYDHFIIDIFGVIHDGIELFPETVPTLQALKDAHKQICLLSNSPRRVDRAIEQMETMGLSHTLFDHAVTSGEATYQALAQREDAFHQSCGHDCWFIGKRFMEDLDTLGLNFVDGPEQASFILNSIPGTEDSAVELLKKQLQYSAQKDLPMICANPDLVVNIGEDQYECAGTFAAHYEEIGGRVVYHGKPHAPVYERCHNLLGQPDKSRICAIGDSLHTDIAGAQKFGIDSIFNLVGIHWEEVQLDHAPGQADLQKIQAMLTTSPQKPDYVMAGFSW